jgi:hypothetical protein
MKYGITVEQKFLVAGHTQMEFDSVHNVTERRIIEDVYSPRDYIVLFEAAGSRPCPYVVKQFYYGDFQKLDGT